jgi:hypothetical protein
VRLIATDLDGTLLRDDRSLSLRSRQSLARAEAVGIALTLVTARPPRFVKLLAEELGLRGAAICCNGALIYDIASGELLEHAPLASSDARALVVALREAFPEVTFAVERGLDYGCEPAYLALGSLCSARPSRCAISPSPSSSRGILVASPRNSSPRRCVWRAAARRSRTPAHASSSSPPAE